jgi:hypothetical protein
MLVAPFCCFLDDGRPEADFGEQTENWDYGIGIRRKLGLVGVGMGVREDDFFVQDREPKRVSQETLWFYILNS